MSEQLPAFVTHPSARCSFSAPTCNLQTWNSRMQIYARHTQHNAPYTLKLPIHGEKNVGPYGQTARPQIYLTYHKWISSLGILNDNKHTKALLRQAQTHSRCSGFLFLWYFLLDLSCKIFPGFFFFPISPPLKYFIGYFVSLIVGGDGKDATTPGMLMF